MNKKRIITIISVIVVIAAIIFAFSRAITSETHASEITVQEAEKLVNEQLDAMAATNSLKYIAGKNEICVNNIEYGENKDIILDCSVDTVDVYSALAPHYDEFMRSEIKKHNNVMYKSALDFKLEFEDAVVGYIKEAAPVSANCKIYLYETTDSLVVYSSRDVINTVYGGINDIADDIQNKNTALNADGKEIKIESTNIKKGFIQCVELSPMSKAPDTSTKLVKKWNSLKEDFRRNFIEKDRWKTILKGMGVTLSLTFLALILGIIIGFIVALVRCTYLKLTKRGPILRFFNSIAQVYLTLIRGTPVVVQIMIIYFVIFLPIGFTNKFLASVLCFGFNSGAYVAEIVRGGIMSVDNGQMEAGRSLGFNYISTMYHIIFPQAFKAVLPALANELVVLLKETSVAFYIGLGDLMYAGNAIRAATYSAFMPLVTVALIYFLLVIILSKLVGILERSLRNSER